MIYHGLIPRKKDRRDYSYFRTFHRDVIKQPLLGSVILSQIPDEFNFDVGLTMPDQNADRLLNGCTGYTQADICTDEDKKIYDPRALYDYTLELMGIGKTDHRFELVPCDIRTSLKAVCALYKRQGYFDALDSAPFDAFDTLRMVMWTQERSASIGSPWFREWENTQHGIVSEIFIYDGKPEHYSWHNYKFSGVKKINDVLYLVAKSWQGRGFGDGGLCYFPRSVVNKALSIKGSFAYTLVPKPIEPGSIDTVKIGLVASFISLMISFFKKFKQSAMPIPVTEPVQIPITQPETQIDTQSITASFLEEFCTSIRDYEGQPGDRSYRNHNPGNTKFYAGGYDKIYGVVTKDKDGFAVFQDYETGWLYLKNFIKQKATQYPDMTILGFMSKIYAPKSDGNDPVKYAAFIGKQMGVSENTFTLKELLN